MRWKTLPPLEQPPNDRAAHCRGDGVAGVATQGDFSWHQGSIELSRLEATGSRNAVSEPGLPAVWPSTAATCRHRTASKAPLPGSTRTLLDRGRPLLPRVRFRALRRGVRARDLARTCLVGRLLLQSLPAAPPCRQLAREAIPRRASSVSVIATWAARPPATRGSRLREERGSHHQTRRHDWAPQATGGLEPYPLALPPLLILERMARREGVSPENQLQSRGNSRRQSPASAYGGCPSLSRRHSSSTSASMCVRMKHR